MLYISVFFTNHIKVSLYYDARMILISLCGRLSYNHVIVFVPESVKPELFSDRKAVIAYCLLVAASSRDFGYFLKIVKNSFRTKVLCYHKIISVSAFISF